MVTCLPFCVILCQFHPELILTASLPNKWLLTGHSPSRESSATLIFNEFVSFCGTGKWLVRNVRSRIKLSFPCHPSEWGHLDRSLPLKLLMRLFSLVCSKMCPHYIKTVSITFYVLFPLRKYIGGKMYCYLLLLKLTIKWTGVNVTAFTQLLYQPLYIYKIYKMYTLKH